MFTVHTLFEEALNLAPRERKQLILRLLDTVQANNSGLPHPRQFSAEQVGEWVREDEEGMRRFLEES